MSQGKFYRGIFWIQRIVFRASCESQGGGSCPPWVTSGNKQDEFGTGRKRKYCGSKKKKKKNIFSWNLVWKRGEKKRSRNEKEILCRVFKSRFSLEGKQKEQVAMKKSPSHTVGGLVTAK